MHSLQQCNTSCRPKQNKGWGRPRKVPIWHTCCHIVEHKLLEGVCAPVQDFVFCLQAEAERRLGQAKRSAPSGRPSPAKKQRAAPVSSDEELSDQDDSDAAGVDDDGMEVSSASDALCRCQTALCRCQKCTVQISNCTVQMLSRPWYQVKSMQWYRVKSMQLTLVLHLVCLRQTSGGSCVVMGFSKASLQTQTSCYVAFVCRYAREAEAKPGYLMQAILQLSYIWS